MAGARLELHNALFPTSNGHGVGRERPRAPSRDRIAGRTGWATTRVNRVGSRKIGVLGAEGPQRLWVGMSTADYGFPPSLTPMTKR